MGELNFGNMTPPEFYKMRREQVRICLKNAYDRNLTLFLKDYEEDMFTSMRMMKRIYDTVGKEITTELYNKYNIPEDQRDKSLFTTSVYRKYKLRIKIKKLSYLETNTIEQIQSDYDTVDLSDITIKPWITCYTGIEWLDFPEPIYHVLKANNLNAVMDIMELTFENLCRLFPNNDIAPRYVEAQLGIQGYSLKECSEKINVKKF